MAAKKCRKKNMFPAPRDDLYFIFAGQLLYPNLDQNFSEFSFCSSGILYCGMLFYLFMKVMSCAPLPFFFLNHRRQGICGVKREKGQDNSCDGVMEVTCIKKNRQGFHHPLVAILAGPVEFVSGLAASPIFRSPLKNSLSLCCHLEIVLILQPRSDPLLLKGKCYPSLCSPSNCHSFFPFIFLSFFKIVLSAYIQKR